MAAAGTSSDIVPLNSMEIETAWHLLTVLIRQGSPTRLAELALRSALAPDLVEILCRILGSRLKFTSGGFISFSNEAVESFGEFMMRAVAWYVPRDVFRVSGMRRGRWNVSLTYVRKRKARSLGNAGVLLSSSKRRTVLTLERGEGEPMKVEGLPKILSYLNKIPGKVNFDVASPSGNDWHSVGMDAFDYSAVGLDQAYNLPISIHGLSCFESRNISNTKEEDTRASDPYITTSVFPHNKAVDFSCEHIPLDVGLDANIIKEEALQRLMLVEPDFRPLLDQSSVVNQTLGEEYNTLSLELGFVAGIPEVHFPERLNAIELDFETSLIDQAPDQTTLHQLDHNTQSASSPLACSNQLVVEAIDERKWHSKDDKLITGQLETKETLVDSRPTYLHRKETSMFTYEFGDVDKNYAAIEDKQRTLSEPSIKDHIASVGLQNLIGPNIASNGISSTKQQDRNVEGGLIVKQKVKSVCNVNMPSKENRVDAFAKATKNSSEQKLMPNFESFIIEEEEGSGGYGTVYKAQRKEDGKIFAVKCPHANAHSHHVYNELKMLERFGGRNFVIKYECSFKNGDSECFVLEHVEHDRPEILKKEIGMFELQWYGFCMFRALASLHKQGVVHRDVKPGNFLFSRKVNKGYLIDFNLASDLQQKFCRSSKFYCVFPFFSSATMRPLVRVYVYCLLLSLNL